jgi:hypothetical protein
MTLFSAAEMQSLIGTFAETVVVHRSAVTVIDPLSGVGTAGAVVTGTLVCSVQPDDGPRRVDQTGGTSTAGNVKIFVADDDHVMLDGDPVTDGGSLIAAPGEGGTGEPPDYILWRSKASAPLHRYRVLEDSGWTQGAYVRYRGSDEGAA